MALEMKVYREILDYRAKVLWSFTWRQFFCLLMGGPIVAVATWWLITHGHTDIVVITDFILFAPFAAWGWWRPKGLDPEVYLPYWIASLQTKELHHDDSDPATVAASAKGKERARAEHELARRRLVAALEAGESLEGAGVAAEAPPSAVHAHD